MTMVERVARAIADEVGWSQARDDWEALTLNDRTFLLVAARAAIEAMREPTGFMTVAMMMLGSGTAIEDLDNAWSAAIDAALKEEP